MDIVKLEKTIYSNSINNAINSGFTQLVPQSTEIIVTPDLDGAMKRIVEMKGALISDVVTTNDPLHGNARVVAAHTPEGAFIELWERA